MIIRSLKGWSGGGQGGSSRRRYMGRLRPMDSGGHLRLDGNLSLPIPHVLGGLGGGGGGLGVT